MKNLSPFSMDRKGTKEGIALLERENYSSGFDLLEEVIFSEEIQGLAVDEEVTLISGSIKIAP